MGKSESKHSKAQSNLEIMPLEAKYQGKSETMVNADVSMLRKCNYQHWKENMNYNLISLDVWYLACNGYTKIPPSNEEVQKNSKELSDIFFSISDLVLNKFMHYTTSNQVWDKLQEIHEEIPKEDFSSRKQRGNHIPNNVSKIEHDDKKTCMMSYEVIDSKDDKLE